MQNKLIHEKSPYLLQHANNPVNWYPWGSEAFLKAKNENKPIFLSIGYSTCHWCHVMEGESFEDTEVADLLNKNYIAIKVDREERPDIDAIYMATCQAFTGQGGWPLTIIMSYDQKPFFAGTYFPKFSRYNVPGLIDLLNAISDNWRNNQDELIKSGNEITNILKEQSAGGKATDLSKDMIDRAVKTLSRNFDPSFGGFGSAPKFPTPHNLMFLLRNHTLSGDKKSLQMVELTLTQMYLGGIFDHIGFGFSRYSTDTKWLIPHFEKMLYDNALLTITYLEAYQITKNELFKTVAVKTMDYVLRELSGKEGGFFCAQDADSDGVEGKFYAFAPEEITSLLGETDGKYFNEFYNITKNGNFFGKSIPNLIDNDEYDKPNDSLLGLRKRVFDYRQNRFFLHKDDKILASWNFLMIVAFAKAYKIIGDEKYLNICVGALDFVRLKLLDSEGKLCVRYRDGETSGQGHLDDYAYYIWALIEMYEVTLDVDYLKRAIVLADYMINDFFDEKDGGFYLYGKTSEQLIFRPKELYDGALPSGNSVAAYCLLKLAKLTGDFGQEEIAYKQLKFIASQASGYPAGHCFYMIALLYALYPSKEVVCVLKENDDIRKIQAVMGKKFMPNTALLIKNAEVAPFTATHALKNDKTTFYVCENNACREPFNDIEELGSLL